MSTPTPDELEPELTAAESELLERLEEACALEPESGSVEDTGELLRIRDALKAATRAADRAVELREQRREPVDSRPTSGVRDFRDRSGRDWRVWAVTPGRIKTSRLSLQQLRLEYQHGWLAFETADGSERRRLLQYPADWNSRSDGELEELLARAAAVAPRRRSHDSDGARAG